MSTHGDESSQGGHGHGSVGALALAAVGIVFGDIGTSPLYTIQECFGAHGVAPTPGNVLGVISQIVWSVTLVVTVKYLMFVMRADNRGEGGILEAFKPGTGPPDTFVNPSAATARGGAVSSGTGGLY